MAPTLARVTARGGAGARLSVARRIACTDASRCEAFACPWTPPSTFDKRLSMERPEHDGVSPAWKHAPWGLGGPCDTPGPAPRGAGPCYSPPAPAPPPRPWLSAMPLPGAGEQTVRRDTPAG